MPYTGDYTELIKLILGEAAKYFSVLLFAVLAIRLWRRLPRVTAELRSKNLLIAGVASLLACGIGYVSVRHSLGRLYSTYGLRSFKDAKLSAAFSLFQMSSQYWNSADTTGRKGICLLLLNDPERGRQLLDEAKKMRGGRSTPFEKFHEGLYDYFHAQPDQAIPLLASCTTDLNYSWRATKLLALILLEKNQTAEAARAMKPFAKAEVKEEDHAYIITSLKLADGQKAEARAVLDRFPAENLSTSWKPKFEKLRTRAQD